MSIRQARARVRPAPWPFLNLTRECPVPRATLPGIHHPMDPTALWQAALERLSTATSSAQYAWLRAAQAVSLEDGVFVLAAESPFAQEMLEQRFGPLIRQTIAAVLGHDVDVQVVVRPASDPTTSAPAP